MHVVDCFGAVFEHECGKGGVFHESMVMIALVVVVIVLLAS